MDIRLPTRLRKEPLVEAVWELRFATAQEAASEILIGTIFSKVMAGAGKSERLPVSELPAQLRRRDLNLRYLPTIRLRGPDFVINIGDQVVGISALRPYSGWAKFRAKILELLDVVAAAGVVETAERFSLKYVDVITDLDRNSLSALTINVQVSGHRVVAEPLSLRTELDRYGFTHILQVASPAEMSAPSGEKLRGLVVDVDSICQLNANANELVGAVQAKLDDIHQANKSMFFELLSADTIASLDPEY